MKSGYIYIKNTNSVNLDKGYWNATKSVDDILTFVGDHLEYRK